MCPKTNDQLGEAQAAVLTRDDKKTAYWMTHFIIRMTEESIMELKQDVPENHGPLRFSHFYLCADGTAAFQALYVANHACPKVIAIIQPGEAFGGNWTDFEDQEKILARSVMNNPAGQPDYLLYGGWGWPEHNDRPCWHLYQRHVSGAGRNLWAKKLNRPRSA